jgi:type VI secretion system secreted protein Hcp
MPIPAYMKIEGVPGSVKVSGREGTIEVLGFDHEVRMPTDKKDGSASGTRVHGEFKILKNYDASTPELFKRLCNGAEIPKITLNWYQINMAGDEAVYFTNTLKNARIIRIRSWMPNVDDEATERYKHMEDVSFQYEKITWKYLDGNIEFSDSWIEGR